MPFSEVIAPITAGMHPTRVPLATEAMWAAKGW